jgi:methylthioribose-1-phosphate isomerase
MGVAVESRRFASSPWAEFEAAIREAVGVLGRTRPTASNLFRALQRMAGVLADAAHGQSPGVCSGSLVREALLIYEEDLEMGIAIGRVGGDLIKDGF